MGLGVFGDRVSHTSLLSENKWKFWNGRNDIVIIKTHMQIPFHVDMCLWHVTGNCDEQSKPSMQHLINLSLNLKVIMYRYNFDTKSFVLRTAPYRWPMTSTTVPPKVQKGKMQVYVYNFTFSLFAFAFKDISWCGLCQKMWRSAIDSITVSVLHNTVTDPTKKSQKKTEYSD